MGARHDRDLGFFIWAVPGFLVVFGVIAMFSIGLPFLLAGFALFGYLLARGPTWPADLGLIAGVGIGSLTFAAIALIGGGYSATPWLEVGLVLVGVSSGLFWWLRCRSRARSTG